MYFGAVLDLTAARLDDEQAPDQLVVVQDVACLVLRACMCVNEREGGGDASSGPVTPPSIPS